MDAAPKSSCRFWFLALAFSAVLCTPASFSFAAEQAAASQQAPANRADKTQSLIEEGERLASSGKRAEAHKVLVEALARAREEKNPASEIWALSALGRNFSAQGKYKEALEHLQPALALAEARGDDYNVARISNSIAIVYQYLGQREDAERFYRRAIAGYEKIGNVAGKANSLINLWFVKESKEKGIVLLTEAAEIARKIGDKSLEARALHQLADGLFNESEFAQAMELLERAEKLLVESGHTEDLPGVYTSMGRLHRVHGLPAEAIPLYEKALEIDKKLGNRVGVIQSLNAIATAHLTLGEPERAGSYYEQALALARETRSPRLIRFMLGNLAVNLTVRGEYAKAVPLLEEVLQGARDEDASNRHTYLGKAYAGLGRFAEAEREMNEGVESARRSNEISTLVHALYWRASMFLRSGQTDKALGDAEEATALLEEMRKKLVPSDFMKQGFTQIYQGIYSLRIQLHEAKRESLKALEVAELARSRAFLDLLATREMLGVSSSVTSDSRKLANFANVTPHSAAQIAATAARLRSAVLAYWTAWDSLIIWVVRPSGQVSSARVDLSLQRLEKLVRSTQEVVPLSQKPPAEAVKAAFSRLRGARQAVRAQPQQAWRELYEALIRPVRDRLPAGGGRLTIVPHGPLLRLSFAALQDEKGRYLLEDYTLHYVPSATLLEFTERKKKAGGSSSHLPMLVVADPSHPPPKRGDPALPPLPGALEEGRAIARLAPAGRATLLSGSEAAESAVRKGMSGKAVVHLATHGLVRDDAPLDSYLALAKAGPEEDGRLKAQEVYALDLQAEMVVLSACRSGTGQVTGDGVAALARAFFYAGTPSLVVTLWDITDEPSKDLLPSFYRAWLRGQGKSESLRAAQLQLLRGLRAGKVRAQTPAGALVLPEHPMFWAGYILLGEP